MRHHRGRRTRDWKRPLAITAATGMVVTGLAIAPLALADQAPANGCADVEIIGARGTGERPGLGVVLTPVAQQMTADLSATVRTSALDYPASARYVQSVAQGAATLRQDLAELADTCPDTQVVLMGYSQGADVVGDALAGNSAGAGGGRLPALGGGGAGPRLPGLGGGGAGPRLPGLGRGGDDGPRLPGLGGGGAGPRLPGLGGRGDDGPRVPRLPGLRPGGDRAGAGADDGAADNGADDNGAADNGAADNGAADNGAADNGADDSGAPDEDQIAAVVLFGDPTFTGGEPFNAGDGERDGIFSRGAGELETFEDQIVSFCNSDDIFCQGTGSLAGHLNYDQFGDDATEFVASKVRAG